MARALAKSWYEKEYFEIQKDDSFHTSWLARLEESSGRALSSLWINKKQEDARELKQELHIQAKTFSL